MKILMTTLSGASENQINNFHYTWKTLAVTKLKQLELKRWTENNFILSPWTLGKI